MTKEIVSEHKAKVLIKPSLASQISCLHNQCPNGKEWSGLLVCKIVSGSLEERKDLVISCEHVFPMDFGNATFTSFEGNEDWLTFFELFPQFDPTIPKEQKEPGWLLAKAHSHHNMQSFHSGTDNEDLYATAKVLPTFLSLVVNYACDTDCKLAIEVQEAVEVVETKVSWKVKNWKNGFKEEKKEEKKVDVCYIIPCEVHWEQEDWFVAQTKKIKEKKKEVVTPSYLQRFNQPETKKSKTEDKWKKPTKISGKRYIHTSHYSQRAYNVMLTNVSDLFLIGTYSHLLTAYKGLQDARTLVEPIDTDDYKKAVIQYFDDVWYWTYFFPMNNTPDEEEVVYCILDFLEKYEEVPLAGHLITAFNHYLDYLEEEEYAKSGVAVS